MRRIFQQTWIWGLSLATFLVWGAVIALAYRPAEMLAGETAFQSSPSPSIITKTSSPRASPTIILTTQTPTKPAQTSTPAAPVSTVAAARKSAPAELSALDAPETQAAILDQAEFIARCTDNAEAAGCAMTADFLASQHQPEDFSRWDSLSRLIYERGFAGVEKEMLVYGSKKLLRPYPLEEKDPAFRYDMPQAYTTILASAARSSEGLIKHPDLTPYQIPGASAEQYIDLQTIFGQDASVSNRHYNLCGPITVMALSGDHPEPFFTRLMEKKSWAAAFLADGRDGVGFAEMGEMLVMQGWEIVEQKYDYRSCQVIYGTSDSQHYTDAEIAYCQLRRWLDSGLRVFSVANLAVQKGVLIPAHYDAAREQNIVEHWFVILQTIESLDGQKYVRIYNSLHNREEFYLWPDFQRIWLESRGFPLNILARPKAR